jgi:branched-chain amino acid transport system permease protein
MGIRTNRVVAIIFAYAAMLAGLAGWLLSPLFYVSADMGGKVSLDAFAACILGGFGSIPGALIGGLLLGLIESLGSFYISSAYIDVIAFGILFAMLVVRPEGIFGEPQLERP